MRPPAPSTSPAISPTPRRSVPLNSMCSWKWARPRSSSRSSAEPARAQIWNSATGRGVGLVQQHREPVREARLAGCDVRRAFGSGAAERSERERGARARRARARAELPTRCADGRPRRLPARPVLRADLPVLRLPGGRGALARARDGGALRGRAARGARRAARRLSRAGGSRPSTSAAARPRCSRPRASRELIDAVRGAFPGEPAEVTLEVESEHARARAAARVPRGGRRPASRSAIQSFDDTTLRRLGRAHRAREAQAHARGLPRRRLRAPLARSDRRRRRAKTSRPSTRELAAALAAAPDHVSAYELTLEPGTPFARAAARGRLATARRGDRRARCSSAPRSASSRRATGATRSRATRGPAARRSTTSATGSAAPCSASAWAPSRTIRPTRGSPHGARRANPRALDAYLADRGGRAARRGRGARRRGPRAARRCSSRCAPRGPRRGALRGRVRGAAARVLRRRDRRAAARRVCSPRRDSGRSAAHTPRAACSPTPSSRTSCDRVGVLTDTALR